METFQVFLSAISSQKRHVLAGVFPPELSYLSLTDGFRKPKADKNEN